MVVAMMLHMMGVTIMGAMMAGMMGGMMSDMMLAMMGERT